MTNTTKLLRRVLLVDDSHIALAAVRRHLTVAGYVVIECQSADEALWTRGTFDVAVLDIELGDRTTNGVQLAIQLLSQHTVRDVLFLSGSTDPGVLSAARRIGTVIDKNDPHAMTRLLQAIASAMDPDSTLPSA